MIYRLPAPKVERYSCMPLGVGAYRSLKPENPLASLTDAAVYWKFEDKSDATGHGNTLTGVNSPTFNTGKIGLAAYVTESGATRKYYTAADSSSFKPGGPFTINFWGYIAARGGNQAVYINRGTFTSVDPFVFYVTPGGNMDVGWGDGTNNNQLDLSGLTINDATWYMWTLAVTPGTSGTRGYDLYQNNSQVAHSSNTGIVGGTGQTATTYVGARGDGSTFPTAGDVRIDSFGFWGRVLTSGERALLYNSGAGADPF